MVPFTRLSAQATTAVVLALAEQPATWRYGHELCQQLDRKPGRLYRALLRLADLGCSRPPGSPRRRLAGRRATATG